MKYLNWLWVPLLIGCATPEYQKFDINNTFKVGYRDQQLTANSFRVRYVDSTEEKAHIGFMRRCSEITPRK